MPCVFHKKKNINCEDCKYYEPVSHKILIIKREAIGDVLRTTSILQPLKKKFPHSKIIWLTEEISKDVLEGNPFIDEIWYRNIHYYSAVSYFKFDILINLDLSFESLVLAGVVSAGKKFGFLYAKSGKITFSNAPAEKWFLMSHSDSEKKRNVKTYQQFIKEIVNLDKIGEIIVPLKKESLQFAEKFAKENNLSGKKIIGVNVGSGKRWITKRWTEENFLSFFSYAGKSFPVLIFGGEEEKDIMARLVEKSKVSLINTGCNNSIHDFFALLNLCDLVITADTLALHAGLGLKKKVVALFGPTSSAEIEMYDRGLKIKTPLGCYCCYKRRCSVYPACMEVIKPEMVFEATKKLL